MVTTTATPTSLPAPDRPAESARGSALKRRRRVDPFLVGIVGVGALLRCAHALRTHVAFGDESCYLWLARNLFEHGHYTYYAGTPELHFPPLFPMALGALHWVVRDWEAVSRVAYVLFGSLLPFPLYGVTRAVHGRRIALLASGLVAILPAFTAGVLFAETLSEPLYLLCLFTGLFLAHRAAWTAAWRPAILAGASLSLAYLTRPEGTVYLGICIVYLLLVLAWRRPAGLWGGLGRAGACLGAFLLVASPYVLYLHSHTGHWALTTKSTTSYTTTRGLVSHDGTAFQRDTWGLNEKGEVKYYAHDFEKGLSELLLGEYRHRVVSDVKANLMAAQGALLRRWVFGSILLLLAMLGAFALPWDRRRFTLETLNIFVIGSLAPVLVYFVTERFLYGLLFALIQWSACGLDRLAAWVRDTEFPLLPSGGLSRRILQYTVPASMAAYLLFVGVRHHQWQSQRNDEPLAAASWLRENTPPDAVILSTGPEVAFHAERQWLPLPYASREGVVAYARRHGGGYLCLRGRYATLRPDQGEELFHGAAESPGLSRIAKVEAEWPAPSYVVYRIEPAHAP